MATYTEHYGLHQWLPEDNFLRTDFNTDLEKIDAALGGKTNLLIGSYSGNSTYPRVITAGVTPKAVLLISSSGETESGNGTVGGLFAPGFPLKMNSDVLAQITEGGFQLLKKSTIYYGINEKGTTYYYCIFY